MKYALFALIVLAGCATAGSHSVGGGTKPKTELFAYGDHGVQVALPFGWTREKLTLDGECGLVVHRGTGAHIRVTCGHPLDLPPVKLAMVIAVLRAKNEQWVLNGDAAEGTAIHGSFSGAYEEEVRPEPVKNPKTGTMERPPARKMVLAAKVTVFRFGESVNAIFVFDGRWPHEMDAEMTKAFDAITATAKHVPTALLSQ